MENITKKINELENSLKVLKQMNESENKIKEICEELSIEYNNRGHIYYKSVQFDSAISDYTNAIQLNGNLAVAFYNRGTIHYRMSRFDKALSDMKIAITLEPNNSEFRIGFEESFKQLNGCKEKS